MLIFPAPHSQDSTELITIFKELDPLCAGYHIDVMDGQFVPNSMGTPALINAADKATDHPLWIHLMVNNPRAFIDQLTLKPNSIVTFHYEAVQKEALVDLAEYIEHKNWRPSLAINPKTPVKDIFYLYHEVDHIVIMSVEPGAAGQAFLTGTFNKVGQLALFRAAKELGFTIAIDGGVTTDNAPQLKAAGANAVAVCSALFKTENAAEALKELQKKVG